MSKSISDIANLEHDDTAVAKKAVGYGKTSGGAFVPLQVDTDGKIVLSSFVLNDLTDIVITTPADNELLAYNSATSKWINQTPAEAGLDAIYIKLDPTGQTVINDLNFAVLRGIDLTDIKFKDLNNDLGGKLTMNFASESANQTVTWLGGQGGSAASITLDLNGAGSIRFAFPASGTVATSGIFAITNKNQNWLTRGTFTLQDDEGASEMMQKTGSIEVGAIVIGDVNDNFDGAKTTWTFGGQKVTFSGQNVEISTDNKKLRIGGTLTDLEIYSDGTNGRIDYTGVLKLSGGAFELLNGNDLRLYDVGNSNYTGFKAPALTGNQIYTLPTADGSAGQNMITNGSGVLSWESNDYLSITSDDTSTTSATEYNIFDQDNYPSATLNTTDNVTANNIALTKADGKFTVTNAGIFEISANILVEEANSPGATSLIIKVGGVAVHTYTPSLHSAVDPAPVTFGIIKSLTALDEITFHVDGTGTTVIHPGSTVNIKRIATT